MSTSRFSRVQKATALIPLALLSAAATASVSGVGFTQASADPSGGTLPDGSDVPAQAIEAPASVSVPPVAAPGATGESTTQIVSTASAASIPAAALAAYQRAETIINRADRTCRLPWQLLAAIGRVESNHGRANGNLLDAGGVAQPGIVGRALDGRAGTSQVADTDAGQYDGDTAFDRAVGPMQFIPATWSTVGVDADGDGQRNPQDIDDSALATAVYLCSGDDDLSTSKGQSAAVYRYNHSASYVATVLAVMRAYQAGDFTTAPNQTVAASYFVPDYSAAAPAADQPAKPKKKQPGTTAGSGGGVAPSGPVVEPQQPAIGNTDQPDRDEDGGTKGSGPLSPTPTKAPQLPLPSAVTQPVVDVLSAVEALTICSQQFAAIPDPLGLLKGAKQSCADKVAGKTQSAALATIPNTLTGILAWLGL